MMLAARGAFLAARRNRKPTARSYVQDGLIAMWDGIENAGWGVHDDAATTWVDLAGLNTINLDPNGQQVAEKSIIFNGLYDGGKLATPISDIVSIEFCGSFSTNSENAIFCPYYERSSVAIYLWCYKGALGAGYLKRGYPYEIDTPCTMYADYTTTMGDFASRALNGIIATPTGVSDYFSSLDGYGFSFRRSYPFSGTVHSVRIYSRALTAEEISANYAVDKARFNLPDET